MPEAGIRSIANEGKGESSKKAFVKELYISTLGLSDAERADKFKKELYLNDGLKTRDFGFPPSDLRHWGHEAPTEAKKSDETEENEESADKKSGNFTGTVRALYDFEAENPTELSFRKGEELYVHYRQCEGWLVGFFKDEKLGLIPENYVEFIDQD